MTPTQTADLTSILPGLAQGERVAVAAAYGTFGGPVTTIAYGVLGDGDLAGRAVLATFYRISQAAEQLSGGVDPSMLVYSMARSEVTDLWQAEIERRRATDGSISTESLGAIALDATGSAWDVRRAIDQLDEDEQTLLKLVHFAAMQPSAIIDYLSISIDELKALSKRAHRELATTLSKIESGEDHSLDHVTSLLCSDAMWTATSDPMVESIMAVIAAGPESLGPMPSAAPPADTAPTASMPTGPALAAAAPAAAAATAGAVAATAKASDTDGGPTTADTGVVRISPLADDDAAANKKAGAAPAKTTSPDPSELELDLADDDSAPSKPSVDLPWNKSDTSTDSSNTSDNGADTFSSAAKRSERPSLATVAPLRPGGDPTADLDARPSLTPAGDAAAARRAHLPLPDPVSAQTAAIADTPDGDVSRLPALPATDSEPEQKRLRFRMSGSSLLAIAAILVGLVMGIGTLINMRSTSGVVGTQTVIRLAGTERLPNATALVTLSEAPAGVEVYLEFDQLGAAPDNFFFQGWAQTVEGEQVPLGTFHLRRVPSSGETYVALWAGVDLQQLTDISVRLHEVGGPNEPSDEVLLAGPVIPIS